MSTKVGDIFVRANLDDKQYRKGLSRLDALSGSFAKSIGRKLTLAGAVAGLGMFAKKATEAGASLNAMGTIIDASLPHMTKQVDDFAKSAGSMFGLSETQAKGFVGKFASMASAMGYTEKQAYNMSTALTGLAGDVASYYHISADDAYAKLGAVFTGETESLKQLGVVMTQNALDQFALQQGFGKTTAQMTELEKTTLRYSFVMDRLKLANGDFAKYANTWSGSLATLKLNWSNFMATVGQGLINILLPLLQVVAKLSNALSVLGSKFLAWTQKVRGIKKDSKQTAQVMSDTAQSATDLGTGLDNTSTNAKKAKKQVQALKRELLGFDKITKLTKQDADLGTTGDTNVNGGVITAGGVDFTQADADVQSFSQRARNYLAGIELPASLQTALTNLKNAFGGLFDLLGNAGKWAYDNVLKPLGEWTINKLAPEGVNLLANAIKVVTQVLGLLGDILKPLFEPLVKPFFSFLGDVAVGHVKLIGDALGLLAEVLEKARGGFANLKQWGEDTVKSLKAKWDELKSKLTDIVPKIDLTDAFTTKFDAIKTKWDTFKATTKNLTLKIVDKFSKKWKKIRDNWNKIKSKFSDKTYSLKLQIIDNVTNTWQRVKDIWNGISSKTATFTLNLTSWLSGTWNNLARKINNAKRNHPKLMSFVPWIPELAEGGWVGKNTPQLAVIGDNKHEGEIVAPESKLQDMAYKASQGGNQEVIRLLTQLINVVQSIDTDVYLDGESIKNNTVRRINNHTRATGQLEIVL